MGHAQFLFPLSLEITSFEVAEIIGSKGQYTLSCMNLHEIEFAIIRTFKTEVTVYMNV